MQSPSAALVITEDPQLLDQVQACAAVAGVGTATAAVDQELDFAHSLVLVGLDKARELAESFGGRSKQVVLLGHDDQHESLCRWSQPLGASVLTLPSGIGWLSSLLGRKQDPGGGRVVAVIGGSGGVGSSTLVIGLAQRFGQIRGAAEEVLTIDGDPDSGGLDLLLGAESVPGHRWQHYCDAQGRLRGLLADLPGRDGVRVALGGERGEAARTRRIVGGDPGCHGRGGAHRGRPGPRPWGRGGGDQPDGS